MLQKIRSFIIIVSIGIAGFFPHMPMIHGMSDSSEYNQLGHHGCSSIQNNEHNGHEMILCIQAVHDISIGKILSPLLSSSTTIIQYFPWLKNPKEGQKEPSVIYFHSLDPPYFS